MDINSPISYKFPYVWNSENMPGTPKVNLLLKELIERNYTRASSLLAHGATLKGIDDTTFRRCLFEFLEDYTLMKFLADNGLNGIYWSEQTECIDRAGYCWSLPGRAFVLGNRRLLDLLFTNRFKPGTFWKNGRVYSLENYAMQNNHFQLIEILLSHGCPKNELTRWVDACDMNSSKSYQYVIGNPDIQWKSYGLGALEKDIPMPKKPVLKPLMFKKTKQRLADEFNRAIQWYWKEEKAKEEYIKWLPKKDLDKYLKDKEPDEEVERALNSFYDEILEEGRNKVLKKAGERAKSKSTDNNSNRSYSDNRVSYKSYEEDVRETKRHQFSFVDAEGNYRRWGDGFIDCKGNYVRWGGTFVDGAGNYVNWGNSFVDGSGSYRRWGDDFVDGAGNYVRVP